MCETCDRLGAEGLSLCSYCTHWVALSPAAARHHEDTEHPQLVLATLRAQLKLAQELQRSTLDLVAKLSVTLYQLQDDLKEQVDQMDTINRTYTGA